ncbi:MAG: CoA pyrophosphatase, partial [Rothia aeria]
VSDVRVTPVLGWWASPTRVGVVDTNESALIARVPVRDLLNPANRHTAYVKRGRITHKTPAFEVAHSHGDVRVEFTVWGFTAIVLDKIFDALTWTVPWDASVLKPAPALK